MVSDRWVVVRRGQMPDRSGFGVTRAVVEKQALALHYSLSTTHSPLESEGHRC